MVVGIKNIIKITIFHASNNNGNLLRNRERIWWFICIRSSWNEQAFSAQYTWKYSQQNILCEVHGVFNLNRLVYSHGLSLKSRSQIYQQLKWLCKTYWEFTIFTNDSSVFYVKVVVQPLYFNQAIIIW